MTNSYEIQCECGSIKAELSGEPKVRGFCHCEDCREFLKVPYHSVNAWEKEQVTITLGESHLATYQHPSKRMQRFYCSRCGETMFNSNAMDWRVVSQLLVSKCHQGALPSELKSQSHFFYDRRIVNINDDLPKRG